MQNPATRPLDSCEVNIINADGDLTLGDMLCQNLIDSGWVKDTKTELRDLTIGFQFSYCGKTWQPITDDASNPNAPKMTASEPLCCKDKAGKYRFERCNKQPFKTSDSCKTSAK